jgi:hypothetical protein
MIDPVTAFAAAQAAFTVTKKLIGAGRELHDVSKSLGSFYEACSDVAKAESQRKNPKLHEKLGRGSESIEQEALQIITHRKALIQHQKDLKFMLNMRYGPDTYAEMTDLRKQIREERERTVYRAMEAKRDMQHNALILALATGICAVLGGGVYLIALAL